MKKPTVGRIVRYFPAGTDTMPRPADGAAAIIVFVLTDTSVNLTVFDANGGTHRRCSVPQRTEAKQAGTWDWPERA
jgi:hypothetical protein